MNYSLKKTQKPHSCRKRL